MSTFQPRIDIDSRHPTCDRAVMTSRYDAVKATSDGGLTHGLRLCTVEEIQDAHYAVYNDTGRPVN